MGDIEVLQDVRRVLAATLKELVNESVASRGEPHIVNQWPIRDECKATLASFGVPTKRNDPKNVHFQGAVQKAVNPEVSVFGRQGYRLGSDSGWTLAAMIPSSEVWAVDLPDGSSQSAETEIIKVNSSVTAFIDLSWRWQAMHPLLLQLGYRDSFFEAAELYLVRLLEIDEALTNNLQYPWWRNMVLDW